MTRTATDTPTPSPLDLTRRAFLRDILAEPGRDDVRLVFSDWLQEYDNDPDWSEFIRVGIARERDPEFHGFLCLPENRCRNCRRLLTLAERIDTRLFVAPAEMTFRVRRGFVAEVVCSLAAWELHGPGLVSRHPVERVEATEGVRIDQTHGGPDAGWFWLTSRPDQPCVQSVSPDRYDSREEVVAALSAELLAWARHKATQRGLLP